MIWYSIKSLPLLWLLPGLLILYIISGIIRRRALSRLGNSEGFSHFLQTISDARRRWKLFLILVAIGFLILALARPAWNPTTEEITRHGRDVVFVLDVSRSMLADDLKPSRLERAKLAISDCLEILEGDRVALVVFAGSAIVRCPLTLDYGFFKMMLSEVEPRSVGRGGTKIGDALRMVSTEVLDSQEKQFKDVVLITDGEDQDSFAVQAAEALGKAGVRLLAVGLGDETNGTPIIVTNENGKREFIKDGEQIVRSKLDGATLRKMASATPGGRYLPVATGNFDLGAVYRALIATAEKQEVLTESIQKYEEKFQIFLFASFFLLFLESMIPIRRQI